MHAFRRRAPQWLPGRVNQTNDTKATNPFHLYRVFNLLETPPNPPRCACIGDVMAPQNLRTFLPRGRVATIVASAKSNYNRDTKTSDLCFFCSRVNSAPPIAAVHQSLVGGDVPVEGHAIYVLGRFLVAHHLFRPRNN